MPSTYRDPNVIYRDALSYRGTAPLVPGIDYERLDNIRILVTDWEGTEYAELGAASVDSVMWTLNGIGTASLSGDSNDDSLVDVLLGEREIRILFTDAISSVTGLAETWQGQVTGQSGSPGAVTFEVETLESYFAQRVVEASSLEYTAIEQLSIAWDLLTVAQTGANMDLGIGSNFVASGITRHATYPRDQHPTILDLITEFTKMRNGFDWEFQVDATGLRSWVPYYPKKGTFQSKYRFTYGDDGNITSYSIARDTRQLLTRGYVGGGSVEGQKIEESYEDLAASAQFGVRVAAISEGSEIDRVWLSDSIYKTVQIRKTPSLDLSITVNNRFLNSAGQWDQYLGKIHTGDSAWVDINDGVNQAHGEYRLAQMTWKSDDTLDFGFVKLEV